MKKITLALIGLFYFNIAFSQTYTTGDLALNAARTYTVRIDVTSALVTLTVSGPDDKYLGLGFGVQSMTTGGDVVIWLQNAEGQFELTDRTFGDNGGGTGIGIVPDLDTTAQDWTVVSTSINGETGLREFVATRLPDTGHDGDYVFSTSATSIDLVWSYESGTGYNLIYHQDNKGITMQGLTLSEEEFEVNDFQITPNPAKESFTLDLSSDSNDAAIQVYDVLGKSILTKKINSISSKIDVSNWTNGVYIIKVSSGNSISTKRFVKQ